MISSLSESSIQLIYNMTNKRMRKVLMARIARYLKLRKNFKEETMSKFILAESMKKISPESQEFERGVASAMELVTNMN